MGVDELRTQDQVNPVEKADNPNSIVDKDEIGRIEAVGKDVENSEKNEKMKGFIEKESKDELNNIKSQCLNVINAFDGSEGKKEEAAQAILSLLRINQILGKVKISGGTPIDLKGNCFNQLVALVGTKGIDFKTVLGNDEGEIVNAACKKAEGLLNKPSEEDQKKIDTWEQSKDEISYLKGISDGLTGQGVNSAFLELRNNLNAKGNEAEREKFEGAVFALIKKCCPQIDGVGSLDKKFYSDKIKEFQQAVLVKSKEEGVADEYKTAWSELSNDIKPVERAIDGKLGRNTLNSLVAFATKGLKFEPKPVEKTDGSAKFEGGKEKKETGNLLERMPTTLDAICKYGELSDLKGYKIFSFHDNPRESDFVKRESGTGNEYVQIAGKKFYIKGGEATDLRFKNRPVSRARYGDVQKITELCFGRFDQDGKLSEGSKIVIDSEGKQIESVIMTDGKITHGDGTEEIVGLRTMGGKVKKGVDANGNEITRNDVKWRIDLFGIDGKDTKTMTREQVQLLVDDFAASKAVLEQAINAYKDTLHKPSRIGRKNLNRFLHKYLQYNVDGKYREMGNKASVEDRLGLPNGLRSDPDEKLGELAKAEYGETKDTLVVDRIINKLEELKKNIKISTKVEESETKNDGGQNKPTEVSDNLQGLGLTNGEIEALKQKKGVLSFEHFNTLDKNIIKYLDGFKGHLSLNCKSITPDLMNVIINNNDFSISVHGKDLSDEQFKLFEGFKGELTLDVKDITPDQARSIIKVDGGIRLNNLKRIDGDVGKILENAKGKLTMLRLEDTPKDVAMSMIENHTGELYLGGIDKMDSDIMGKIIGHKEEIWVRMNELDLGDESILNMLKDLDHKVSLQSYKIDGIQNEKAKDVLKTLIDSDKLKIIDISKDDKIKGTEVKFS